MIIALASPRVAPTLDEGLETVRQMMFEAAAREAEVICFPEAYLPGLRGLEFDIPPYDEADQARVLAASKAWARELHLVTILGMEWLSSAGRQIAACVLGADGELQGVQVKTQLAPEEDDYYVPGETRQMFEVAGVPFGVVLCHEGWRYPETVRWAATRGAKIVFHPHFAGSNETGPELSEWGAANNPYYEKAMQLRSLENTIYFASVNYALDFPECATSIITPIGKCLAYLEYGSEGLLIADLDLEIATGEFARRYAPDRYIDPRSD